MILQMEDRGLTKSQPTVIIGKEVKWHSHYGHQTKEMVQQTIEKIKKSLEQEVSSRAGLPTFHFFLVNDIVAYLVTKPAQWPPSQ